MAGSRSHEIDLIDLLPGTHYCAACAERVCSRIAELDGVKIAECDLEEGKLTVTRLGRRLSAEAFESAVRRIALEETDSVAHAAYRLTGLD